MRFESTAILGTKASLQDTKRMTKMDCEIVHVNESLRIKLVLGPGVEN
jgi:hypothetical protein